MYVCEVHPEICLVLKNLSATTAPHIISFLPPFFLRTIVSFHNIFLWLICTAIVATKQKALHHLLDNGHGFIFWQ